MPLQALKPRGRTGVRSAFEYCFRGCNLPRSAPGPTPWETPMKTVVLGALAGLVLAAPSLAQGQDPTGTYLSETGDTRVRIARCGGSYCGTIVAVKGDARDSNNPDPGLRSPGFGRGAHDFRHSARGRRLRGIALQLQRRQDLFRPHDVPWRQCHAAFRLRPGRIDLSDPDLDEGELSGWVDRRGGLWGGGPGRRRPAPLITELIARHPTSHSLTSLPHLARCPNRTACTAGSFKSVAPRSSDRTLRP